MADLLKDLPPEFNLTAFVGVVAWLAGGMAMFMLLYLIRKTGGNPAGTAIVSSPRLPAIAAWLFCGLAIAAAFHRDGVRFRRNEDLLQQVYNETVSLDHRQEAMLKAVRTANARINLLTGEPVGTGKDINGSFEESLDTSAAYQEVVRQLLPEMAADAPVPVFVQARDPLNPLFRHYAGNVLGRPYPEDLAAFRAARPPSFVTLWTCSALWLAGGLGLLVLYRYYVRSSGLFHARTGFPARVGYLAPISCCILWVVLASGIFLAYRRDAAWMEGLDASVDDMRDRRVEFSAYLEMDSSILRLLRERADRLAGDRGFRLLTSGTRQSFLQQTAGVIKAPVRVAPDSIDVDARLVDSTRFPQAGAFLLLPRNVRDALPVAGPEETREETPFDDYQTVTSMEDLHWALVVEELLLEAGFARLNPYIPGSLDPEPPALSILPALMERAGIPVAKAEWYAKSCFPRNEHGIRIALAPVPVIAPPPRATEPLPSIPDHPGEPPASGRR